MIEILGIKLSYEALGFILAFTASELIGVSKLKENSVIQLLKTLVDTLRPARKEDEKVAAVKSAVASVVRALNALDD